jgi:hypothetical protein
MEKPTELVAHSLTILPFQPSGSAVLDTSGASPHNFVLHVYRSL